MPTYVITNRYPNGYTGSPEDMAAWNTWFDQLGDNLRDRGNPAFRRSTLGDCGPNTSLGGYSLIAADDLDQAVALAKGCPALQKAGGVEVGELTPLNDGLVQRAG